jgi:hypothetical protein
MLARLERGDDPRGPQPMQIGEQVGPLAQDGAVGPRVGDEQQEVVARIVSALERDSPLLGLRVVQPHLQLDRRSLSASAHVGVPGSPFQATLDCWQRNFSPVHERRRSVAQELAEALGVGAVSKRRATREDLERWVQAQDRRDPIDFQHGQRGDRAGLDARVARP